MSVRRAVAPVPYRLVRSARARGVRIRVQAGRVTVSAPPRTPVRRIEALLHERRDWLADALARAPAPPPLLTGASVPLLGGRLVIDAAAGLRPGEDPAVAAERILRARARLHLSGLVQTWAPRLGVEPRRVVVRGQRARWGSASGRGEISLNWRLMMAPPEVGEYVVVHELAHLVHMDHGPRFWALVRRHLPGMDEPREWLRRHGGPLLDGPAAAAAAAAADPGGSGPRPGG
ncbi:MAG TPA: SprT family zinc-dependent metalloprotease [Miltoncostaeaceae bacterium]|nr:SprT family zinc-dependent metalloprotease [Miltoncostaeaceae bacterium]